MGRIIELCGSPGVGKSSIFYELEKRRDKRNTWTTASNHNPFGERSSYEFMVSIIEKIKTGIREFYLNSNNRDSLYGFTRLIYREIKKGKNFVDLEMMKEAGYRFVAEHPKYIEACWGNIFAHQAKSLNGLDLRFEKAEFIYRIIKKNQIIREKITDQLTIIDEGFINMIDRGLYKSMTPMDEKKEIYDLLKIMPLPDALIYIDIDINENAKRLLSRVEIRDMHKGLSENELKKVTQTCRDRIVTTIKYLEKKEIPVLYIDSSNSVKENADKIIQFTENLALSPTISISENTLVF